MKSAVNGLLRRILVILGVAIATSVLVLSCSTNELGKFKAPLFENIGDYRMDVSTKSKDARLFFDQGIVFTYGYNHGEAARSFREAIRLDSSFAMAYWGLAYALGPNYNAAMEPTDREEVLWATSRSQALTDNLKDWEVGLIQSGVAKYVEEASDPQLTEFEQSLRKLSKEYAQNADVLTFLAEALMLQHPWDMYDYKGGPDRPWTPEIVEILDKALSIEPNHPLANHLMIHATEAASQPGMRIQAAEALSSAIIPGAGHLVHMPSHTYINTGDYHLGTEVNIDAVRADSSYAAQCKVQGAFPLYYYHNYHFLAACAALEGRGTLAIESSFNMINTIDESLLATPGFETTQHFMTIPYNVLVKFAQWEKILALPEPDNRYPYLLTVWRYAKGMAYANLDKLDKAKKELLLVQAVQSKGEMQDLLIFGINSAQEVVNIAAYVLEGEIAQRKRDYDQAEQSFLKAIAVEDNLSYNEPPDWFFSVRHLLGDMYLQTGRSAEAEEVYKKDLANFPKNGFALNGLYHSLINQGKNKEAGDVLEMSTEAWKYADSELLYSRIDNDKRMDLALKVAPESPKAMIFLAASFCNTKWSYN